MDSTDKGTVASAESPLNRLEAVAERNSKHYSPLPSADSIRIMKLHPGTAAESISFSLEISPDYRKPAEYTALSYCWGDTTEIVEVYCDQIPFSITKSLHGALWLHGAL
jgi:hypothetical protein